MTTPSTTLPPGTSSPHHSARPTRRALLMQSRVLCAATVRSSGMAQQRLQAIRAHRLPGFDGSIELISCNDAYTNMQQHQLPQDLRERGFFFEGARLLHRGHHFVPDQPVGTPPLQLGVVPAAALVTTRLVVMLRSTPQERASNITRYLTGPNGALANMRAHDLGFETTPDLQLALPVHLLITDRSLTLDEEQVIRAALAQLRFPAVWWRLHVPRLLGRADTLALLLRFLPHMHVPGLVPGVAELDADPLWPTSDAAQQTFLPVLYVVQREADHAFLGDTSHRRFLGITARLVPPMRWVLAVVSRDQFPAPPPASASWLRGPVMAGMLLTRRCTLRYNMLKTFVLHVLDTPPAAGGGCSLGAACPLRAACAHTYWAAVRALGTPAQWGARGLYGTDELFLAFALARALELTPQLSVVAYVPVATEPPPVPGQPLPTFTRKVLPRRAVRGAAPPDAFYTLPFPEPGLG